MKLLAIIVGMVLLGLLLTGGDAHPVVVTEALPTFVPTPDPISTPDTSPEPMQPPPVEPSEPQSCPEGGCPQATQRSYSPPVQRRRFLFWRR